MFRRSRDASVATPVLDDELPRFPGQADAMERYIARAIANAERRVSIAQGGEKRAVRDRNILACFAAAVVLLHFLSPPKLKLVPVIYERNPVTGVSQRAGSLEPGKVGADGLPAGPSTLVVGQRLDAPPTLVAADERKWIRTQVEQDFTVVPVEAAEKTQIQSAFANVSGQAKKRLVEWWRTTVDPIDEASNRGYTRVHDLTVTPGKDPHTYTLSWLVDHFRSDSDSPWRTDRLTGMISVKQVQLDSQNAIDANPEQLNVWFWSIEPH